MTEEFDQYKVKVILKVKSSGHHDAMFPDRECSMEFDATDATIEVMLDQFKDFLSLIGYVIRPDDDIKLVKHYD